MCENAAPEKISREELKALQQKILDTIGETIGLKCLQRLVHTLTQEVIRYQLANWYIHKLHVTKTASGYFIHVVENDMKPVMPERKSYQETTIPQRDRFEQRQYTDEYLESFYADLTD